jgi:hypothetical protein
MGHSAAQNRGGAPTDSGVRCHALPIVGHLSVGTELGHFVVHGEVVLGVRSRAATKPQARGDACRARRNRRGHAPQLAGGKTLAGPLVRSCVGLAGPRRANAKRVRQSPGQPQRFSGGQRRTRRPVIVVLGRRNDDDLHRLERAGRGLRARAFSRAARAAVRTADQVPFTALHRLEVLAAGLKTTDIKRRTRRP